MALQRSLPVEWVKEWVKSKIIVDKHFKGLWVDNEIHTCNE